MIVITNPGGGVIATFDVRVNSTNLSNPRLLVPASKSRELMHVLRQLPTDVFSVIAVYPGVSKNAILFNQDYSMDLEQQFHSQDPVVDDDVKVLFAAPVTDTLPDDGILNYALVSSVFDLAQVPDRSVIQFDPRKVDLLKMIAENAPIIGVELRVLVGVPGAEYGAEFTSATWNLESVSYTSFINELRVSIETEKQLRADPSVHGMERGRVERKDGSVKQFTRFDVASAGGTEDEITL